MKINYKILLSFLLSLSVFSCGEDELDINALTDFAPGILQIFPGDGNKVVKGDFDIVAKFVDGTISPLQEGTLKLMDIDGNELASTSTTLSGTADSVVLTATDFNAASLELGFYRLSASATDVKGQVTSYEGTFEISNLPFAANNEEMFIAGTFNGWGGDRLELTAPHTWTASEVNLNGGAWKFKNCINWCGEDWGDPDGDGRVEITTGTFSDSPSSPRGLYNVTFNDQTLNYVFEPSINFEQNVESLFLLGSFNNFEGSSEYEFTQIEDNIWKLEEVQLNVDDLLKFSEGANFQGINFGDADGDYVAEEFGPNITFAEENSGFYEVIFNDKTLEYQFTFLRFPSIGIIGPATPGGWADDTDLRDNGDGTYSTVLALTDGFAKFRANDDWPVNWGATDFPSGVGVQAGPNIPVTAGIYLITLNPSTGEYSFEEVTIGIIGNATPGGWGEDTDMTPEDLANPAVLSITLDLVEGAAKFRANNNWPFNWGAADFPSGTGIPGGDNIPVTAGTYKVTFNVNTGEYSFELQ